MWAANLPTGPIATYRPLSLASFVVDHALYGLNAAGYHLTSILLHALAQVFVFLLIRRWLGAIAAFALTLLVAFHPTGVEAVAWINGRSELFVELFGVWALLCVSRPISGPRTVALTALLFLAMLGKETGLFFAPLVVAFVIVDRPAGAERTRDIFRATSAGSVAAIAYFLIRGLALAQGTLPSPERSLRSLSALPACWFRALQSALLPLDRGIVPVGTWLAGLSPWEVAAYWAGALLIVVLVLALWRLDLRRPLLGLFWWFLVLLPMPLLAVSLWPGLSRWVYVGMPGLVLAVHGLWTRFVGPKMTRVAWVTACLLLLVQTERTIPVWANDGRLFLTMAEEWPESPGGYLMLGGILVAQHRDAEAENSFRRAIARGAGWPPVHSQLAAAVARQGRCREAVEIMLEHRVPEDRAVTAAYVDLAMCFERQGDVEAARRLYAVCLEQHEPCAEGLHRLGAEAAEPALAPHLP
jgi:hypothetical protein